MNEITYERPKHFSLLNSMREQDQLCDVTIQVDGQRFRAHKNILAATIPYFERMFLSDFQESNMEIVPMMNITASNMDVLIAFAYTGKITLTEDNVESLIIVADYLQLNDIKQECGKFLTSILRVENVYKTYQFADAVNCSSLKEESHKFICWNIHHLVHKTKDFLDFKFNLLRDVLIENDLRYAIFSPSELIEIIIQWLTHNINDRKMHLPELIRCVKLSAFTFTDLHNYSHKNEVVAKSSERELWDSVADTFLHQKFEKQGVKNADNGCLNQTKGRIIVVKHFRPKSIKIYDPYTGVRESIPINEISSICCATVHEGRLYLFSKKVLRFYEFEDKRWGEISLINLQGVLKFAAGLGGHLYLCEGDLINNKCAGKVVRFCLRTEHWEHLTSMTLLRFGGAIITFRRHVYVLGGMTDGYNMSNIVERYNPETNEWAFIPRMQMSRVRAAAAVLNEKIYVCGGSSENSNLNSVEFYDPETNRWEYAAPMNEARNFFIVVALAGKLWAIGGLDDIGEPVSSIETYDPDEDTWSITCWKENNLRGVFGGVLFNEY